MQLGDGSLDDHLSAQQQANLVAFSHAVQTTLHDVWLWCLFLDDHRFHKVVAPTMRRGMLAPLRWFVPQALRTRHLHALAARGMVDEHWVKSQATSVYKALATMLSHADGPFFFGNK